MRRWFNDFLHDSEYERALAHARSESAVGGGDATVSVWSHVLCCRERYANVLWTGPQRVGRRARGKGGDVGGGRGGLSRDDAVSEASRAGGDGASGGVCSGGSGRCGVGGNSVGVGGDGARETPAGGDRRHAVSRRGRGVLPTPLWPSCGVRSLAVWQRAWASLGLQVSDTCCMCPSAPSPPRRAYG